MAKIFGKELGEIVEMGIKAHCTGFETVVVYDVDDDKFSVSKYSTGEEEPTENHLVNIFRIENTFSIDDYLSECYPEDDWENVSEDEKIDSIVDDYYTTILDDFDSFKQDVEQSLNIIMNDVLSDEISKLTDLKSKQLEGTCSYDDWYFNEQFYYAQKLTDFICEGIDIENFNEFSEISPREWLNFEYNELELRQKEATTNIRVNRSVRNRLAEIGSKDDSFNDIVVKLLEFYEENH